MARRRMVTRTLTTTTVEIMCLNVNTAQVEVNQFKIMGAHAVKADMLKIAQKQYETDNIKLVNVQRYIVEETLYGMDEKTFMELAQVLPPRTTTTDDEIEDNE